MGQQQPQTPEEWRATRTRLQEAVQPAREDYDRLSREFNSLTREVPSGLPAADGVLRIHEAGEAMRFAFRKYQEAMKRFAEFVAEASRQGR